MLITCVNIYIDIYIYIYKYNCIILEKSLTKCGAMYLLICDMNTDNISVMSTIFALATNICHICRLGVCGQS